MSSVKICRTIGPLIHSFFMVENTLEPRLQLLSQVIENMVYVGIINGIDFSALFPTFSTSVVVFIGLLMLCLIKLCLKVALRFGISLIFLQMIVQRGGMWLPVNIILLFIFSIAQLMGSISFDYSSEAVHSQSKAANKVMRLVLMMANVGLFTYVQNDTYIHLVSLVLFLVVFISKATSLIKNQAYREIVLRFYLWAACQHLRLFTNNFISTSTPAIFIFAFLFSQAIFSLIDRCKGTVNCHELLAKEERLKLAFILLRYAHSSTFDPELQKFVYTFIEDAGEADQLSKQQIEMSQSSGMNASKQRLCQAVLNLLDKSNGFLEALLKSEIHAENGRLLVAVQGLARIRERLSLHQWLRKILVLRAHERISSKFERVSGCVILAHEKEWLAYLAFQSLLHKASSQHLRFNLYLRKTEIELTKVKQMCKKIISIDSEAARAFQKVRNGFSVSTELFVSFLAKVRGDFVGAQQILSRQRLREKQLLDGGCQQKIYIRLGLSAEGLTISRVGFNTRELLGFNRADLEGQKIQRLVPSFFRSQHQRISTAFIRDSFQKALLFQKKTVVLNGEGNYDLCSIVLKLRLDQNGTGEDTFCFEGHLRVTPSEKHNLSALFVVNSRGIVVESTDGLFQDVESANLKVQQLFDGNIGEMLSRTNEKHLYQVYEPVLCLSLPQTFYFYAKQLQRKRENTLAQGSVLTEMAAPLMKCKQQSMKSSQARSDQIQAGIRSKQIIFLFALTIVLILCLFGSEYLMIVSARVKYNNQKFAVINFMYLIKYYNATQTLNLNLVYVDLRDNYNYSNSFFVLGMEEAAAQLQGFNENLKQFNQGRYKLPTYNSKISYQQSNYELIMMLVSENYLYKKFSTDPFAKKTILDQSKLVSLIIASQSITDYRASIFNLMTSFVENDFFYERLSLGVSLANILVFTLIALRLFFKLRAIEEYALEKRCEGTFYHKKIGDILDFMKQISQEQVGIDKINQQMHIFERASKPQSQSNNNSYLLSEASLIKEGTGRNIMGDTLNKTGFLDDLQKAENKLKPQNSQAHTFKKSDSHRMVLVFFGIFMAILAALDVTNEIINYRIKNLDEVNSLNGVLNLFKTNGYYTSRGVTVTMNTILLKNLKGYDNTAVFNTLSQSLYTYIATFSLPVFTEVQFPEFADFATNLSLLYQSPICTYVSCDPQYQDEINLNFISMISKYAANLTSMVKTTSNYTQQQLATYIASNKRYIDLLFYTEMVLRRYITNLIILYLDSHILFMENLYSNKMGYIYTMMAVTAVGLASFLLFIWSIRKEQDIFIRMVRIYQEPIAEQ